MYTYIYLTIYSYVRDLAFGYPPLHISRDGGYIFCSRSAVDRKIVESTFLGSRHFRAFEVSRPSKSFFSGKNDSE